MRMPPPDAALLHAGRFVLVQDLGNAFRLSVGGTTCSLTDPRKRARWYDLLVHLDAELRAQVGHGGGGSANNK